MAIIREVAFNANDESFTLVVADAAGGQRELHLAVETGGVRVTVFHGTEHALIPLSDTQAQELALWLVRRAGFPPGYEYRGGRLTDA